MLKSTFGVGVGSVDGVGRVGGRRWVWVVGSSDWQHPPLGIKFSRRVVSTCVKPHGLRSTY